MQKRFSCPDFSKRAKVERKPDAEPVPEPPSDVLDRSKSKQEFHPAPYLIGAALIVSLIISVVLLASPASNGRKGGAPPAEGRGAADEQDLPILPPEEHRDPEWTEHRRVEPVPADEPQAGQGAVAPQPARPAVPEDEPEVIVIRRDPEGDLFDFSTPAVHRPDNLSEDVKEADELLEKGRDLIRRWDAIKTQKTSTALEMIVDARETLKKAMDAYRAAADKAEDDPYIKSQHAIARGLYYLALKSSPLNK